MNYLALAAVEITLLGLLSGIVGTLIVFRRRAFFAVALSHATFPGGVVFALAGWNLLAGQALFALLLVLIMTLLARVPGQGRQVTSGVVLSFGFALGALLTSLNPGLGVPVEALLVGSPLAVTLSDIMVTAAVLVFALCAMWLSGRAILFHTFDPAGFAAAGSRAGPIELIVSGVIAAGVVVAMPAVGAILGVALLIGPAAAARLLAPRMSWVPALAAALGVFSGLLGLWISRAFDIAAGGAIGCTVTAVYLFALALRRIGLPWKAALRARADAPGARGAGDAGDTRDTRDERREVRV